MEDLFNMHLVSRNPSGETFIDRDVALDPTDEFRADYIWMQSSLYRPSGLTSGKWVIKIDESDIDREYEKVLDWVVEQNMLSGAKCSTSKSSSSRDTYVVCVYNDDFHDTDNVRETGRFLDAGLEFEEMGYKPDIFTKWGVYPDNLDHFDMDSEYLYTLDGSGQLELAP